MLLGTNASHSIHIVGLAWEASQYWEVYHMLMSRDDALAWKRLWEPRPQTPVKDPNTWHTYIERFYHVPNQPPIPMPSTPRPTTGQPRPHQVLSTTIDHEHNGPYT